MVDDDQIEFEIADGVRVRQMRQMISIVRAKGEPVKASRKEPREEDEGDEDEKAEDDRTWAGHVAPPPSIVRTRTTILS